MKKQYPVHCLHSSPVSRLRKISIGSVYVDEVKGSARYNVRTNGINGNDDDDDDDDVDDDDEDDDVNDELTIVPSIRIHIKVLETVQRKALFKADHGNQRLPNLLYRFPPHSRVVSLGLNCITSVGGLYVAGCHMAAVIKI
uniref:Uncharacterized protein n=1 Tax=Glossina austeni TaxID=7395 RepID=A0A1A9V2C9_GLOAU